MFDRDVFLTINGLSGRIVALDAFFIFAATWLPYAMIAAFFAYAAVVWKTTRFTERVAHVLQAMWAVLLGLLAERLIGFLWFRPRPFVTIEEAIRLIDRFPHEKSFPSAHATLVFAIAVSLLIRDRRWGWPMAAAACLVAVARICVGVHYPSDVFAGALVGSLAALAAAPAKAKIVSYLGLLVHARESQSERT